MAAGHGGPRPGAGRKPGQVSKAKIDIAEKARSHGPAALATIVTLMNDPATPPAVRLSAANSLMDRGYGKPLQAVDHSSSDGSLSPLAGFQIEVISAATPATDEAAD